MRSTPKRVAQRTQLHLFRLVGRFRQQRRLVLADGAQVWLHRISWASGSVFQIGIRTTVLARIAFERDNAALQIGSETFVGGSLFSIAERVEIGSNVLISSGCFVTDHDSHSLRPEERKNDPVDWENGLKDWSHVRVAPVLIQDNAWIGINAIILAGVTVGEGAVVAAGSVVTKDVPTRTLVAGNPARVVRENL